MKKKDRPTGGDKTVKKLLNYRKIGLPKDAARMKNFGGPTWKRIIIEKKFGGPNMEEVICAVTVKQRKWTKLQLPVMVEVASTT